MYIVNATYSLKYGRNKESKRVCGLSKYVIFLPLIQVEQLLD